MTDELLKFGKISSFAASSADTFCPNVIDLVADGVTLSGGINAKIVFVAETAVTGFVPRIYSGSTATPTEVYAQGAKVASMAAGDEVSLPLPMKLLRYVRAGGTATSTSGSVSAHIEIGGPRA